MKNLPTFEDFINESNLSSTKLLSPSKSSNDLLKNACESNDIKKIIDDNFIDYYKEFVESKEISDKTNYETKQAHNALIAFYELMVAIMCNRKDKFIQWNRRLGEHELTEYAKERIWALEIFAPDLRHHIPIIKNNLIWITGFNLPKLFIEVKDLIIRQIEFLKQSADRQNKSIFDEK